MNVKDNELLVNLDVFNSALINNAVYKFKHHEDASLVYTGVNKHENESVGLYDTMLSAKDYKESFVNEEAVEYGLASLAGKNISPSCGNNIYFNVRST